MSGTDVETMFAEMDNANLASHASAIPVLTADDVNLIFEELDAHKANVEAAEGKF